MCKSWNKILLTYFMMIRFTKVNDFGHQIFRQEYILRFQIKMRYLKAMNKPHAMHNHKYDQDLSW